MSLGLLRLFFEVRDALRNLLGRLEVVDEEAIDAADFDPMLARLCWEIELGLVGSVEGPADVFLFGLLDRPFCFPRGSAWSMSSSWPSSGSIHGLVTVTAAGVVTVGVLLSWLRPSSQGAPKG